MQAGFVGQAVL